MCVCEGPLSILQPALLGTPLLNMLNITEPFCSYCIISVPRAFWLIVPAPLYIFYITLNRFTLINIRDVYLHSVADYGKCLYKFHTNTGPFVLYILCSVCLFIKIYYDNYWNIGNYYYSILVGIYLQNYVY